MKSEIVDRLELDPRTGDFRIKVDVKQRVVVLGGAVGNVVAKRAAGDDTLELSTRAINSSSRAIRRRTRPNRV